MTPAQAAALGAAGAVVGLKALGYVVDQVAEYRAMRRRLAAVAEVGKAWSAVIRSANGR